MRRWIDQWPAIIWPGMSLASLYILGGTSGRWRPTLFVVGAVLALLTFALALYLAMRPVPGREGRNPKLFWPLFALGFWYLALAAAASFAGTEYAVAGLAAGLIPLSAMALMIGVARRKTAVTDSGRWIDVAAESEDDPFPGIGLDDHGSVLGDTPERPEHPEHEQTQEERRRFQRSRDREQSRTRE